MKTLKVNNPEKPGDFMVINESDFDKEKHTVFKEKAAKAAPAKSEEKPEEAPAKKPVRRTKTRRAGE